MPVDDATFVAIVGGLMVVGGGVLAVLFVVAWMRNDRD